LLPIFGHSKLKIETHVTHAHTRVPSSSPKHVVSPDLLRLELFSPTLISLSISQGIGKKKLSSHECPHKTKRPSQAYGAHATKNQISNLLPHRISHQCSNDILSILSFIFFHALSNGKHYTHTQKKKSQLE